MFLSPPPLNCKELYGPQGIREVVYTLLSLSPTWLCVVNYWQKTGERKNLFDDQDAYAICYIRATCVFQDQTELTKHHLTSIERNGDWQSWQPRGHAGSSPTHTKMNIYEHRDKSKEKLFFFTNTGIATTALWENLTFTWNVCRCSLHTHKRTFFCLFIKMGV